MRFTHLFVAAALALAPLPACDLDVGDLNNPGIADLEENPTPSAISAAATGLLIGNRGNFAQANGYVAQLGILGREAFNFDVADPRFIGELLEGDLNPASPFGGNFWAGPYANIRLANTIIRAVDKVAELSDEQKAGVRGYARTIKALDLLQVIVTRDVNGAVIDTDKELGAELAPIEDKAAVYAEIARLLDEGHGELTMAGEMFFFPLSSGYDGFDTPATFAQFNRAIRARAAAYTMDYQAVLDALAESFIAADPDMPATFDPDLGVYHAYSTGPGDTVNNLINPNIYAHPSLATDAQMMGQTQDRRFTSKVTTTDMPGSAQGLTSDLVFTLYTGPNSSVPIIRNEELVLLRAEAKWFTGDKMGAIEDLNLVRTTQGGLAPIGQPANDEAFITALLYERRYSLLFEGGHRWIDVRRFGREEDIPLDLPEHRRNFAYPIPATECNARPDDPKCG